MTIDRGRPVRRVAILAAQTAAGLLLLLCVAAAAWLTYGRIRAAGVETLARNAAAPNGGRWTFAHDTDIHLREWGPRDGKPLLLVHGTGAWNGTWADNVESMAVAGFRVIAMDLPPFGFSLAPANGDYSRVAQARRIQEVMRQIGAGPVTLLGHSFGGGPAAEAAMLDPALVAHLVLVDAAIAIQERGSAICAPPAAARLLLGWRPLRTSIIAAAATEPAFSQFWLRQFVARKEVVTDARTAIYQRPFSNEDFSAHLGDWAHQFAVGCESPASVVPENFRKLTLPVSILWGALDSVTPLVQGQQLKALLPRSRLVVLPGVGHIPQIEDPALFNVEIAKVLRSPP